MMPAAEATALNVIQPELAFELLIGSLRSVAFLEQAYELRERHLPGLKDAESARRVGMGKVALSRAKPTWALMPLATFLDGFGFERVLKNETHPEETYFESSIKNANTPKAVPAGVTSTRRFLATTP